MSVAAIGFLYAGATLSAMLAGIPIAFALGFVALAFMYVFMPGASLDTVAQNVYEEMASITLLSIPLFILKGAAIGRSKAGQDLYSAMHAWMHRIPGGLGIANVFACALFAAMAGSSPATCSAIGSAGIPGDAQARLLAGLRGRHHRGGRHARHPAAALDHHDPLRGGRRAVAGTPVPRRHRPGPAAGRPVRDLGGLPLPLGIRRRQGSPTSATARRPPILSGGQLQHAPALLDAAAGAALRDPAHRRDGRALRRLRHALRDGGPRRPPGARPDRGDLRRLAPEGRQPDPHRDAAGIDHADADHRHVAPLRLRDELPAHLAIGGRSASWRCSSRNGCCW